MIAEGIETNDQADWFRTLGCRLGQGFLYARPMPMADVDRYLLSRERGAAESAPGAPDAAPTSLDDARLAGAYSENDLVAREAAG